MSDKTVVEPTEGAISTVFKSWRRRIKVQAKLEGVRTLAF